MSKTQRRLLIGTGVLFVLGVAALLIAASILARRFEPYIREQAIAYLSKRFDSQVELAALRVRLPNTSPLRLLLTRGRGAVARVEGEGISMRHKGRRDVPPMFAMKRFRFEVDLGTLFEERKTVNLVHLDGMEIHIPPPGQRPRIGGGGGSPPQVLIRHVAVDGARLVILPRDPGKRPLDFEIHKLRMESAGTGVAMKYDAVLTNAKPPGLIQSQGKLGPWNAGEPGDTPLEGQYTFDKADLGVFKAIAGILNSTGSFQGSLSSIRARGEAVVPDFRLKRANNPVRLATRFQVLVDGTNGNTVLEPVHATLGSTRFTTSGGVIKHEGDRRRTIELTATMPDGDLRDVLRLAMKGTPFMEGRLKLKTTIDIPPLSGKVKEKIVLDGQFEVSDGKFLRSTIQEQIDRLSRRGQGEPKNQEIDEVVSEMSGDFRMENQLLTFRRLAFGVPGAQVQLAGSYDTDDDVIDMRGSLRLRAKVSQTMSGWKRWALKPVDPFFSKHGAGTFLRIQVVGSSRKPQFGRDKGPKPDRNQTARLQGDTPARPAAAGNKF